MTSPDAFSRAPPLLPGLIAADVCISSLVVALPSVSLVTVTSRFTALITPVVTDCPYPSALPIAMAVCPIFSADESPKEATRIFFFVSSSISFSATAITARSLLASTPLILASTVVSSAKSTVSVCAPSTTWLFVAI